MGNKKENPSYEITIRFDNETNKILVRGSQLGNWMDLGLTIEGLGTLMAIERNENYPSAGLKGIKTREELFKYVYDYLEKVSKDYDKSFSMISMPDFNKQ